jgi:serine/threonine protein kinase/formylglycine-generating enzyme required for sulfatase activity
MPDPDHSESLPTKSWSEATGPLPARIVRPGPQPVPPGRGRWQAPTPEEVQRSFPLYEIISCLGRGGMGAVYKGWQKSLHRFVAIKILPPEADLETADFAERFQREARALARLQHPGIVAVHDAGETADGLLYFVMEYVEGTDVHKMVASTGKLAPDRALAITVQVCDALEYAHGQGVIHRDIKPSNIMVEKDGRVKVADFGLAKVATDDSSLVTGTHASMGTPEFMAPEAMAGMANVDHRADLYAVGVMLYQMLTGELPRGRFELPSIHTPGLDVRFDAIIDRAMQKRPEKRYSSAVKLRSDLERIQTVPLSPHFAASGEAVDAGRPSTSQQTERHIAAGNESQASGAASAPSVTGPSSAKARQLYAGLAAAILAVAVVWGAIILAGQKAKPAAHPSAGSGNATPAGAEATDAFSQATKDDPFENELGMKFVPVKIAGGFTGGRRVLFSIWVTRAQDYQVYVKDQGVEWPEPHPREPALPAVNVSWNEARAFCAWLTARERKSGRLSAKEKYRLPTDHEWSCAIGLGDREDPTATPEEKNMKIADVFPWGTGWPPPAEAGNYSGEEAVGHENWSGQNILFGYRDPFPEAAPVGSFPRNPLGLFDLGSNVHEWCADRFKPSEPAVVLRGASFVNDSRENLLASYRLARPNGDRSASYGFRVVVTDVPNPRSAPASDSKTESED